MAITVQRDALDDTPVVRWSRLPDIALTLLRVVAGLMFMQHGVQKLFGLLQMPGMPPFGGPPPFLSMMWIAGVLETFGGLLVALGALTRPVAFLLSGQMAVAYFMAHAPRGFWPVLNQGEVAALYCFVFLAFAALGGGPYSVDGLFRKRRGRTTERHYSSPSRWRKRRERVENDELHQLP
jgi:putative oxidoreductase